MFYFNVNLLGVHFMLHSKPSTLLGTLGLFLMIGHLEQVGCSLRDLRLSSLLFLVGIQCPPPPGLG
jgi:hypothetical protein